MKSVPFTKDWQQWFCDHLDSEKEKEFIKIPKHMHGYQILNEYNSRQDLGVAALLGVVSKRDEKIGYLFFDKIDLFNRHCLGHIFIAPEYRQSGILPRVLGLAKEYVFVELGLNTLYGEIDVDRYPLLGPSLISEGFKKVGVIPNFRRYNGKYIDVVLTAVSKRSQV